jgi:hypothetical protein
VHYCTQQIVEKYEKNMQIWMFHFTLLQFKFPNEGLQLVIELNNIIITALQCGTKSFSL